jgi:hypothetical protein
VPKELTPPSARTIATRDEDWEDAMLMGESGGKSVFSCSLSTKLSKIMAAVSPSQLPHLKSVCKQRQLFLVSHTKSPN